MEHQSSSVIKLFEKNELDVSELYKIYSDKIPEARDFWDQLSLEEVEHAQEIREFCDGNDDCFKESKFALGTIRHVSDFVQKSIKQAEKRGMSHVEALNVALRIEQSFLEKKCFEIFIPSKQTVKDLLSKLNSETEGHIERLRK